MEMAKEEATKAVSGGCNDPARLDDEESCEEVIMETLEETDVGASRVNVDVSHESLADHLQPLGSTSTTIRTQTKEDNNGSPKKKAEKVFKDVTNKLEVKPIIAKASRPISKSTGAQQAKQFRILKRSGRELVGPQLRARLRTPLRADLLKEAGRAVVAHQTCQI